MILAALGVVFSVRWVHLEYVGFDRASLTPSVLLLALAIGAAAVGVRLLPEGRPRHNLAVVAFKVAVACAGLVLLLSLLFWWAFSGLS